jgi:hypothetical protein
VQETSKSYTKCINQYIICFCVRRIEKIYLLKPLREININ